MGILIDIILIATVVLSIWSGVKRGFIRSLMNIITFSAALLCGWYFYPSLAVIYSSKYLLDKFTADIYNSINTIISSGIESIDLSRLFADKPDAFLDITRRYSVDINLLEEYFNTQVMKGSQDITADISTRIAAPVANGISEVLAFLTIFLGVVILLKIVTLILDLIFKLPVLNAFNRVAGFVLGSVCGLAYAWILSIVIAASLPFLSMIFPVIFTQNTRDSSIFLNLINSIRY
ncbi:MAG: CvpA family protein [Eubacteriales bacterium]